MVHTVDFKISPVVFKPFRAESTLPPPSPLCHTRIYIFLIYFMCFFRAFLRLLWHPWAQVNLNNLHVGSWPLGYLGDSNFPNHTSLFRGPAAGELGARQPGHMRAVGSSTPDASVTRAESFVWRFFLPTLRW